MSIDSYLAGMSIMLGSMVGAFCLAVAVIRNRSGR